MRGVNLGSQFIIEPWMAYDEFNSMGCGDQDDEWSCVQHLGQDAADAAFATHWDTWITKEDIVEIASFGLNTVRIPVGFWIKEDLVQANESFPRGALPYLDQIVSWCSDAGLYVIIDLHAGPGGQAISQQFTGHSTAQADFFDSFNYDRALDFLSWMTARIHTHPSYTTVGTLEVINEPAQSLSFPMLSTFYPAAMTTIRSVETSLSIPPYRALHIQYMATAWGSGDPTTYLPSQVSTLYDDHRYFKWDPSVPTTPSGYLAAACTDNRGPVVVGEWSLAVADAVASSSDFSVANPTASIIEWYRQFFATQASAYERSGGWVFWSWKCNWIGGVDDWRWCYQSAVKAGVIPTDLSQVSGIAEGVCGGMGGGGNETVGVGMNETVAGVAQMKRRDKEHLRRHRLHGPRGSW